MNVRNDIIIPKYNPYFLIIIGSDIGIRSKIDIKIIIPSDILKDRVINSPTFLVLIKIKTHPRIVDSPANKDNNNGIVALFIIYNIKLNKK